MVSPDAGDGKTYLVANLAVALAQTGARTVVLDADLLEAVLSNPDPKKAKEIEIKLKRRLHGKAGNPKFKHLSER